MQSASEEATERCLEYQAGLEPHLYEGDLAGRFLPPGTKNLVHDTDTGGRLDRCIIHANPQPRVFWYIRLELALKAKHPCVDQRMLHATADWMSGLYSHGKLQ